MARLLAIDTSMPLSAVAAGDTEGPTALRRERVSAHSETLIPHIEACLKELHWAPADLEGVACGAGPGSFTGLRIGCATAKGLCYALRVPLLMVSSLEIVAARGGGDKTVLACQDAGRGEVYARLVPAARQTPEGSRLPPRAERLLADARWPAAELVALLAEVQQALAAAEGRVAPLYLRGGALAKHPQLLLPGAVLLDDDPYPDPRDLLRLGQERFRLRRFDDLAAAEPNYLNPSAAERNRPGGPDGNRP